MVKILSALGQITRRFTYGLAIVSIVFLPLTASLEAVADGTCTPPTDPGPGIHHPVGADAGQYIYNCDSKLWVSPHYTYDPSTGLYTASDPVVYKYDSSTGAYDYTSWDYNAPQGKYIPDTLSTANPPSGATIIGGPAAATSSGSGNGISNTGPNSSNGITDNGGVTDGSNINNTGPNSNNQINGTGNNNTNINNSTNASVTNQLTATASTGDATVISNTTAGGATTGDAEDIANVENMLQSASNALGGNAVTFVANIDGDVNGDLMLDPSTLSNVQPSTAPGTNTTNIVNNSNESITNNLDLAATSGDATVTNNTSGGDATSGAAKTIANVVNLIDSAVTSGKSFLGVININGNLNGDILMPSNFIDQLLAANVPTVNVLTNTGPSSSNTITDNGGSNNTTVNNNNNEAITNTVNSNANTGNANVSDNTSAGSAASGTANTSITAFNLTGSNVIGKDDMLVFVNVVGGKWVGLIVDAPAGATAAELGGGITSASTDANNDTTVNNNSNQKINNNLNLNSTSGSADVTGNTKGGNATSGNADNAVNLLNVQNSSLALSDWFGVLFINVFGTWNGSFGVNTSAGDPISSGAASGGSLPGSFTSSPAFGFRPNAKDSTAFSSGNFYSQSVSSANGSGSASDGSSNGAANTILAAAKNSGQAPRGIVNAPSHLNWSIIIGGGGILVIYLLGESFYATRQKSRLSV